MKTLDRGGALTKLSLSPTVSIQLGLDRNVTRAFYVRVGATMYRFRGLRPFFFLRAGWDGKAWR